jgi:hypothetical protein
MPFDLINPASPSQKTPALQHMPRHVGLRRFGPDYSMENIGDTQPANFRGLAGISAGFRYILDSVHQKRTMSVSNAPRRDWVLSRSLRLHLAFMAPLIRALRWCKALPIFTPAKETHHA